MDIKKIIESKIHDLELKIDIYKDLLKSFPIESNDSENY